MLCLRQIKLNQSINAAKLSCFFVSDVVVSRGEVKQRTQPETLTSLHVSSLNHDWKQVSITDHGLCDSRLGAGLPLGTKQVIMTGF